MSQFFFLIEETATATILGGSCTIHSQELIILDVKNNNNSYNNKNNNYESDLLCLKQASCACFSVFLLMDLVVGLNSNPETNITLYIS